MMVGLEVSEANFCGKTSQICADEVSGNKKSLKTAEADKREVSGTKGVPETSVVYSGCIM